MHFQLNTSLCAGGCCVCGSLLVGFPDCCGHGLKNSALQLTTDNGFQEKSTLAQIKDFNG